jgi:hypothetical protein
MNEQASAWLNMIDGLPDVHARLRRVAVLNHDALDVTDPPPGASPWYTRGTGTTRHRWSYLCATVRRTAGSGWRSWNN